MAFIGDYMRGVSGDTGMPSIIGLQQYIQQGFDAGRAQGQNQQLAQLSQAAFNDTGDQQQQDVSRAIGIDPKFGYSLAGQVGAQSAAERQTATLQKLGKVASAIVSAKQRGDEATAEGLYQAALPDLRLFASQRGAPPPPNSVDGSDMGAMYKLAAMYGGGVPAPDKGVVIAPGGQLVNPTTGAKMASVPTRGQVVGGYYFDPNSGTASPIPIRGAQNGMGMGATVQGNPQGAAPSSGLNASVPGTNGQSVTFDFPPGTPPEVIAAAKASAVANGDIAPGAQPQAGTLATALNAGKATGQAAPSGYQWNADHTALQPIPGGPADKGASFQGEGQATLFGDPSKTGTAYLATIPAGSQEIVRGLLNGTVALPSGTALKNGMWQSALASVKHADPTWNQAAYKQFADTRKFMTTGQGGQLVNSINTAAQHLEKLRDDIDAMHNGNVRPLAAASNFLSSHFAGDQAPTNFTGDLTPVASELAAVYKGKGVPSDEEIRHFREALTPNMSYGQQMNVIRGWIDLLAGKLNATREQYRASMSKLSDPLSVINPRAAEALERITNLANDVSTTGRHAMPAEDTAPINAPGQQAPQTAAQSDPALDALLKKYGGG